MLDTRGVKVRVMDSGFAMTLIFLIAFDQEQCLLHYNAKNAVFSPKMLSNLATVTL
jgi:hypothetical protein